jgi:restriction system protein
MSIWEYKDTGQETPVQENIDQCIYCRHTMVRFNGQQQGDSETSVYVDACQTCGWWLVSRGESSWICDDFHWEYRTYLKRAAAVLRNLEASDISLPIGHIQQLLLARYDLRFTLHPRRYEDLVGGVFREFGYEVRATSYSRDDGIDLFVFDGEDGVIGVQVKKHRDKIKVDQIREFAGALVLKGLTRGIFVTTSDYTRGSKAVVPRYKERGLAIELIDASGFLDRLCVHVRPLYAGFDDQSSPYCEILSMTERLPVVSFVDK